MGPGCVSSTFAPEKGALLGGNNTRTDPDALLMAAKNCTLNSGWRRIPHKMQREAKASSLIQGGNPDFLFCELLPKTGAVSGKQVQFANTCTLVPE